MKQPWLITTLFVFLALSASQAQGIDASEEPPKRGRNNTLVFGNYLRHLNSRDVETNGPNNFLSVKNTNGYQIGAGYERVTSYNLMYSATLAYGKQIRDMQWDLDPTNFDPDIDLGFLKTTHPFYRELPYLALNISAGYQHDLGRNKKWLLQSKMGITSLHHFEGGGEYENYNISYVVSTDPLIEKRRYYAFLSRAWGNGGQVPWHRLQRFLYTFYLGTSYRPNKTLLREVRMGFTFTRNIFYEDKTSSIGLYYDHTGKRTGSQFYADRYRTVGLAVSLVF